MGTLFLSFSFLPMSCQYLPLASPNWKLARESGKCSLMEQSRGRAGKVSQSRWQITGTNTPFVAQYLFIYLPKFNSYYKMSWVQLPELALCNILSPSKQRDTKPQKSRDPFQSPGSLMIHVLSLSDPEVASGGL